MLRVDGLKPRRVPGLHIPVEAEGVARMVWPVWVIYGPSDVSNYGQATVPAEWKRGSVPMTEVSTMTEVERGRSFSTRYSRR